MGRIIPKEVAEALEGSNYSLTTGSRHIQIRIDDRLVSILPMRGAHSADRATKNVIAAIRRAKRGVYPDDGTR